MNKGFCNRIISMIIAICMILTLCPVSVMAGNEGEAKEITASKLVAGAYSDLSQAEKDLIDSELLADVTYEYYVPDEGDGLIQVDTENKTIKADSWPDGKGNVWNPVGASIFANGSVQETVTLDGDGAGTYTYPGNAFSVEVSYEMYISVDTAVQEQMLNTSSWLKAGVANLDTIADQSTNMGVVELAMPQLVELRDMKIYLFGETYAELSAEGKAAITALNDQMTAHDGKLTLHAMVVDYRSGSKTEYLLNTGSQMQPELLELTGHVSALAEALNFLNNNISVFVQYGAVDAQTGEMISLLTEKVNDLKAGLESAAGGDWTAAEKGTALVKADINANGYAILDSRVEALGETATNITITESIRAAETAIQHNLSMKNITVQVELEVVKGVVDSDELVSGGVTGTFVLTLAENATKAEMEAALAETTVEAETIAAWGDAYVAEHYVRHVTELPETLAEDIDYIITYSPDIYTITYDYDEGTTTKDVPYGYRTTLELYPDSSKVYDYTVNGDYLPQGSVYTVLSDVTVTRQTGKPYTTTDLYTAIAGMEGVTDKEKAILTAGALQGNVQINVRYPDTDAGSLVSIDSNLVLTGKTYASDYEGLVWAPYNYIVTAGDGTDAAPAAFTRNGDIYTAQITDNTYLEIKVYYRLSLTNLGEDAAQTALNLVERLVEDSESQNDALASLSSPNVSNNLGMLDAIYLDVLEGLIERNTLHAVAEKDVLLKECFTNAIGEIRANCLNATTGTPRIAVLISGYNNSPNKLVYYYRNSESFITEIGLLSQLLNDMLAADENLTADEKLAALAVLIDAAPDNIIAPDKVDEYTQKLPDLQEKMNEIKADLLPVNTAIDTTSPNLNKLVNALQMTGTVGTDCNDYVYLQSQSFNVAGSGKIILKVNVTYDGVEKSVSETVDQNSPILQTAIDSLKDKVAALLTEMGIDDAFWYESAEYDDGAALDALVGQSYATNKTLSFTWVMLEHTYCEIYGHTEQVIPGEPATCTSTGLTDGVKCSVCEETLVTQQEIPVVPHTEQVVPGKAPTCTATGLTEGKKCSVCHQTLVPQNIIEAQGHDFSGAWVNDDPSGHWHVCQRGCGAIDAVVPHSYDTDNCAEEAHCIICTYTKEAGGHVWGPLERVDDDQHKQVCSSCGEELKNPHSWTLEEETDPTCEESGYKKFACSCGAEKTEEPEALGHSWGPWIKDGIEDHTRVCSNDTTDHCRETEPHTWDQGQLNDDGDMVFTCTTCTTAEGDPTIKVVVQDREQKLESGATIKVQLESAPGNDGVVLPKPEDEGFEGSGYRYDYVVDGVTYPVTNDGVSEPIYPSSVAGATVKLVNIDNEKLETLVGVMSNAAVVEVERDPDLKPTNDDYYTGIKVETDANGLMGVVMTLVQQEALGTDKYGYVAVDSEPLLNNNKVSLLGLLRMMMKDINPDPDVTEYAYTSQDIIDLSNGTQKTLISSQLVLRTTAPNTYAMRSAFAANDGHELDFQILLTATPAGMAQISTALTAVEDYITFDIKAAYENDVLISNRLDIDVKANLPAKVYEIYVAALRLSGEVDVNDTNAVKEAVAYEFLKDYVDVLLGANVTTTTLMNTASKLGKTVNLAEYEGLFNAVKGKLDYGRNITYSADGLTASVTLTSENMEKVVDQLEPMVGDEAMMDILKTMVVECQDGQTVDVKLNAFVTNFADGDDTDDFIDTNYEAIIVDVGAAKNPGLTAKADVFDITENLAASVGSLKGAAAIMLQKNVTADLHFKKATILDLNGHTINGTITADAKLIIIDSTLATATVGGVTGTITGSDITIVAGTYGTDVSDYLKNGYVQESGIVKNSYYAITKAGSDITFEVNADILATRELPSGWLAADMAADLAMNYFTTASLAFAKVDDANYENAYSVFAVNFDNLLALITETTGEEKVDAILEILKLSGAKGIEGFINDLLAKSMDFGTLAGAINGNTELVKYNMVTRPWNVKLDTADGEDYLTVSIEPGEEVHGSVAVTVVGAQDNKDKIAAVLTEMDQIMDPTENSIAITLQDPAYANRTLTVTGSGNVTIDIDMSTNPDYAAIVAIALASSGVNKDVFVNALTAYFADSSDTDALYEALSTVTLAQYISALKSPALGNGFSAMIANLGLSAAAGNSAAELGDTFRLALVAVGRVLAKLEIDGDSRVVFGTTGKINYANSNVTRNIARTVAGVTVSGTVTAENISVTVALFHDISCEHVWGNWEKLSDTQHQRVCTKNPAHVEIGNHNYEAVVTQPDCDEGGYTTHTCPVCRDSYKDTFTPATGNHPDADGDNICDECNTTICQHVWGAWTDLGNGQHQRVCANNPAHVETAAHTDANGDNLCDDCNATICNHSWGAWTDLGNGQHQRVCANNPAHVETAAHVDANGDRRCDACGASMGSGGSPSVPGSGGGGGGSSTSHAIDVLNANMNQILNTDSFAAAVEAAREGSTIKISGKVAMTQHAYVNTAITIIGADKLDDTGYVIYLNNTAAKLTADAKLNVGSNVEGYKVVCAEGETFTYTLEKINAPETDAPVAGSKVAPVNNKLYLLLDLPNDGMTLNALRESTAYSDLTGTIKFEIEGNDGTGLIKTTDRMTVSAYNADNNRVATITYIVIVMGDTNCNGKVNTSDATVMKNINFGETYDLEVLIAADVNFSGTYEQPKVNSSDATYIMSKWFNWGTGKYTTNLE